MKNVSKVAVPLLLIAGLFSTVNVNAKTFDGVIKGAECHLYGKFCSEGNADMKYKFEKDYVLVSGDHYYFLDLLPIDEKIRLNNQSVRIVGDLGQQHIAVNAVSTESNGHYMDLWNWEDYKVDVYGY